MYGSDKSGSTSNSGSGSGSGSGSNNNSSAPGPTTAFRPTQAKVMNEADEPYFYMGFFPSQAVKTLEPISVNEKAKDAADAIYYTVSVTGIVHGINLEEDSIYVQFTDDGETKQIPVATGEIKSLNVKIPDSENIKNYGRYTAGTTETIEEFGYTLPIIFTYEMLTTMTLTIQNSGLGLKDKKISENDGAVLTATNGIETYKIIVYRNAVGSFV